MKLEEGAIIDGKYRIVRLLGRGGMGVVYVAENLRVKRQVAIKVLSRAATELHGDALVRFEREAQAAGQIGSDHIVEVLDLGTTEQGDRFMVMELLEGETLKERAKRGRISIDKIVELFRQLLDGLEAAHAAGIIHRDLKPDNVFLQKKKAGHDDWVKILDFGISKFSGMSGEAAQHTRTGVVMGTPFYMSPEQARAASSVDARSDLYTVAVMLYEMLTGQVPFSGETFAELMFKIVFESQPHPKAVSPMLDDEICGIVVKGMHRDPAARFQSADEFRVALAAWEEKRASGQLKRSPLPSVSDLSLPPRLGVATPEPPPVSTPLGAGALAGPPSSPSDPGSSPPNSASLTRQTWAQSERASVPAGKRKGGLVAAGLAVVVAVSAGGGYIVLRGGSRVPEAPSSAAAAPAPTPEPEQAAPAPSPSASAATIAPPASASAAAKPASTSSAAPAVTTQGAATKKSVTKKVVTDYGY
ncbi:serine/threonine protein kinase [Polyangium sorediatum]|uniref:Serine/threonine-protein kinase n=1 Tax=Polyangium sorediatum TaxID=889274 RepID=A0ABT6NPW9_9BACT|nr:serine/threonine-protein kinase [Polyangium sorediatum]MDI1430374.1 serine/threonine-protein kinase [Polyangium sorediatum]